MFTYGHKHDQNKTHLKPPELLHRVAVGALEHKQFCHYRLISAFKHY